MEGEIEAMFRAEAEGATPEQVTEPIVETAPEAPTVEPVAQPEEQPEPSPEPIPEVDAPKETKQVPLATFLDQRDELKEVRRRLAEFEASTRERPAAPSPFDDPEGYAAYTQQVVDERLTQERFAMSDMFARQQHGAETVDSAVEWAQSRAQSDPAFAMSYMRQQNPIDWIVQQHRQSEVLGQIGNRPLDDFIQDYIAKNPGKFASASVSAIPVETAMQPAPKPQAPPKSIAGDASPTASAPADPSAFWSFLDRK
jgi:hypothetical protein